MSDGAPIWLGFTADGYEGYSGCNRFSGSYELVDGSVEFSPPVITLRGCGDGEAAFHGGLADATQLVSTDDGLVLSGPDSELRFFRWISDPIDPHVGRTWLLRETVLDGVVARAIGAPATLQFDAGGALVGSTGCRRFTAEVIPTDDWLRLESLVLDGDCVGDVVNQDSIVMQALQEGFSVSVPLEGEPSLLVTSTLSSLIYELVDEAPTTSTIP